MIDVQECFYGSVTVGERGQIVIPAEARAKLGFKSGDKLLVMKDPVHEGLIIARFDQMILFLEDLTRMLKEKNEASDSEVAE
jgi:AbrB family looped-hinge helix DNA binding protein